MTNYIFTYENHKIKICNFIYLNAKENEQILNIRNDEKVGKFMYSNVISKKTHESFIKHLKTDKTNFYAGFYLDDILLGVGSLTNINHKHKRSYLGIYKNPNLKLDFGIGQCILKGLEMLAFNDLGLNYLHLEVVTYNIKAIRFYERLGYIQEGTLKEYIKYDDKYFDVLIYGKKSYLKELL